MSLDKNDLAQIEEISVRTITAALNELVLPRLEEQDEQFGKLEAEVQNVRSEMRSGFAAVHKRIDDLSDELNGRIDALEADIKELYLLTARLERENATDQELTKLTLEKKLLKLNAELLATAKQAGITLPR